MNKPYFLEYFKIYRKFEHSVQRVPIITLPSNTETDTQFLLLGTSYVSVHLLPLVNQYWYIIIEIENYH